MQFKLMQTTTTLTLCLLVLTCICALVTCRPSDHITQQEKDDDNLHDSEYYGHLSSETIRKLQKCDMNMDVMELCMRCAKVTKSQIVYPLCCDDEDDVQGWCHRYIFFGQRS